MPTRINRKAWLPGAPLVVWSLLALGLAGCGTTTPPPHPECQLPVLIQLWPDGDRQAVVRPDCDPLPGSPQRGGSFVFTLTDSVVPDHAPVPHNPSERIVFANLYETLIQMDCQGRPRAGLAERWACTEDSTVWVFTLRDQACFWDGSPVTAPAVRAAWQTNKKESLTRDSVALWSWIRPQAETITVLDARRLAIHLPEPQGRFPYLLAHPATAVAVRRPGWTWPVGSGPCRLRASTPAPLPDLECLPNPHYRQPPPWQKLVFLVRPDLDPRELAFTTSHLAVVRDLQAVRVLSQAPGLRLLPLPWDRLYLLLCPPRTNPRGSGIWWAAADRLDIPQDVTAVATSAWPHLIFPAGDLLDCPQLTGPALLQTSAQLDWQLAELTIDASTLVYDRADPGARELAQRLVALAPAADLRCTGAPGPSLAFAIQWQMPGAAILTMKQVYPSACLQLAALLSRAAWLQQEALGLTDAGPDQNLAAADRLADALRTPPEAALLGKGLARPLAVTRPWLVVRGDLAGLELAFDGTPLLAGLGLATDKEPVP